MMAEHKLLLALSAILKPSYPHLEELHADVEQRATDYLARERGDPGSHDAKVADALRHGAQGNEGEKPEQEKAEVAAKGEPDKPIEPKPGED